MKLSSFNRAWAILLFSFTIELAALSSTIVKTPRKLNWLCWLIIRVQTRHKLSIRSKFTRSRFQQTTNTTKRTNEPNSVNFNQCARVYFVIRNTRARHVKQPAWQAASNEVKPDITRTCYRLPLPELQLLLSINYYAFIRIFNGNIHIICRNNRL